jgi:hypothetical protein
MAEEQAQRERPTYTEAELDALLGRNLMDLLRLPRDANREAVGDASTKLRMTYSPGPNSPEELRPKLAKVCQRVQQARDLFFDSIDASTAASNAKWGEARQLIARVLERAPNDADCRARLGWYAYNATQDPKQGLPPIEQALAIDPKNALAIDYRAKINVARGRQPEAPLSQVSLQPVGAAAAAKRRKPPIALIVLLVLSAAAVGVYFTMFSSDNYGIPLAAKYVRQGSTLKVDLGGAWYNLGGQQKTFVTNAGNAVKDRGIDQIDFTDNDVPVARNVKGQVEILVPFPKVPGK